MIYPTTTVFIIGSLALLFVGATPIPQSLAPGQNAPVEQRYKCTTATAPALPGIQLCSAWDAATQTTCSKWESVGCAADSLCIVKVRFELHELDELGC